VGWTGYEGSALPAERGGGGGDREMDTTFETAVPSLNELTTERLEAQICALGIGSSGQGVTGRFDR